MGRIFKYLKARQWLYVFFCFVFVVLGVCLELKMPDYMSKITMLVETPCAWGSEWPRPVAIHRQAHDDRR